MLNSAPRKAASGTQEISPRSSLPEDKSQLGKKISPSMPPKEAPPEIPSICGQASGLRSRAWSTVPQAAIPPPMATPRSTRGRRARKNISAAGFATDKFPKACDRSRRTGPSSAQPTTDSPNRASSAPLTQIIFLRLRTFTAPSFTDSAFGLGEAFRMHEAGDFFQSFANAGSWPQDLVRWIGINAPFLHSGNGLEIRPVFGGPTAVRSHARFDDDLRRFCDQVLVGEIEPRLRGVAGNVFTAGESNQLIDKIPSPHCDQRAKPYGQKSRAARRPCDALLHFIKLPGNVAREFFPRLRISQQAGDALDGAQNIADGSERNQIDLEAEALHLPCLDRIGGAADADHHVRPLRDDHFETGAHETPDLRKLPRFGGVIAVGRHSNQAIAETERKYRLGHAGR